MADDDTAQAANWRTVLLVDLLLAAAVTAAGVAVLLTSSAVLGALLAAAGMTYAVLIARRGRRWARIRRDAGL
jgi:hypothetical protein